MAINQAGAVALLFSVLVSAFAWGCQKHELPLATPGGVSGEAASLNTEGIAAYYKGVPGLADGYFKDAIKARPEFAEAHFNLALTFHKEGNHDEAAVSFSNAKKYGAGNTLIINSALLKSHTE